MGDEASSSLNVGLIILSIVTYVLTVSFNALAGSGAAVGGLFESTVGDISDKYQVYITPSGSTFSIWGIIYTWLAISLLGFAVTVCVKTDAGRLYLRPEILSPSVTGTLSLNFVLNLVWIFVWDRTINNANLTILASIILFFIAITNVLVMVFMAKNIGDNLEIFQRDSLEWWLVFYRFVLNGLGVYTTWTVIASLLNLNTAVVYAGNGGDQKVGSLVSLSLLVIIHVTYFIIENFRVDYYARYILTPYLVVIWASNGIWQKKKDDPAVPNDIKQFVLAIIIIASLTFLVRVVIVTYRYFKKPLKGVDVS